MLPPLRGRTAKDAHEQRQNAAEQPTRHTTKDVAPWIEMARRDNHGRAHRAADLAWREVFKTVPRDRIELARLQNVWPRLMPPHLQEVAWPSWLGKGRLLVHVSDNQWLHELTYMRRDLLGKLRRACPTARLHDLRLRVGEVEVVPPPVPVPERNVPSLPVEPERATIDAMKAIDDQRLRDAVAAARLALGSR